MHKLQGARTDGKSRDICGYLMGLAVTTVIPGRAKREPGI
jgi:hypothetical protein